MVKKLIAAAAALAGTAAIAQAPPAHVAPSTPPAPMVQPMHNRVMTRAEAVAMVREHFGRMDADKNGAITTAELGDLHGRRFHDFSGGPDGHAIKMGDPNAAFDRLDANKDGSISRDEFAKGRELRIERRVELNRERKEGDASSPKDGQDVRRHVRRMRHGSFGGRMIVMADANRDGQITLAEAEALALQHFDQMDSNRDGQVTPEERRAGRQMMFKQFREQRKQGS